MNLLADERGQDNELAALADQARRGSAEAFDALARRVRARIRRWALEVTNDTDDADDVAQLVLLKLHARVGQFEGRSRFTSWLYRITRNVALNRVRRDRRRGELLAKRTEEIADGASYATETTNETDDEKAHLAGLVQYYLAELSDRQRAVFELADLRGVSPADIARRLDITPSTVRGLLMKARRRIRLKMLTSHAHLLEDYTP